MRRVFATVRETPPARRGTITAFVLLIAVALSAPAFAQSFLGTIRGTVTDPQGQVVPGAAVLITDDAQRNLHRGEHGPHPIPHRLQRRSAAARQRSARVCLEKLGRRRKGVQEAPPD